MTTVTFSHKCGIRRNYGVLGNHDYTIATQWGPPPRWVIIRSILQQPHERLFYSIDSFYSTDAAVLRHKKATSYGASVLSVGRVLRALRRGCGGPHPRGTQSAATARVALSLYAATFRSCGGCETECDPEFAGAAILIF